MTTIQNQIITTISYLSNEKSKASTLALKELDTALRCVGKGDYFWAGAHCEAATAIPRLGKSEPLVKAIAMLICKLVKADRCSHS